MRKLLITSIGIVLTILSYVMSKHWFNNNKIIFNTQDPLEQINNLIVFNYDYTGTIKNWMLADNWTFCPNRKISWIQSPTLIIMQPPNYKYIINSNHAKIFHQDLGLDPYIIKLYSKVIMQQQNLNSNLEGFELNTESIEYEPSTQLLTSNQIVTIFRPNLTIKGKGMKANLINHQIELLQNITTEYQKDNL